MTILTWKKKNQPSLQYNKNVLFIIIMSVMELGQLSTHSGFTYLEVSSEVCHDSFCLHVVSSPSCIPAVYLEPVLFLIALQCVNLFHNLSQVYPAVLLMYYILNIFDD